MSAALAHGVGRARRVRVGPLVRDAVGVEHTQPRSLARVRQSERNGVLRHDCEAHRVDRDCLRQKRPRRQRLAALAHPAALGCVALKVTWGSRPQHDERNAAAPPRTPVFLPAFSYARDRPEAVVRGVERCEHQPPSSCVLLEDPRARAVTDRVMQRVHVIAAVLVRPRPQAELEHGRHVAGRTEGARQLQGESGRGRGRPPDRHGGDSGIGSAELPPKATHRKSRKGTARVMRTLVTAARGTAVDEPPCRAVAEARSKQQSETACCLEVESPTKLTCAVESSSVTRERCWRLAAFPSRSCAESGAPPACSLLVRDCARLSESTALTKASASNTSTGAAPFFSLAEGSHHETICAARESASSPAPSSLKNFDWSPPRLPASFPSRLPPPRCHA
eukprot:1221922-Pleurochrysis_carterae.AAC.4